MGAVILQARVVQINIEFNKIVTLTTPLERFCTVQFLLHRCRWPCDLMHESEAARLLGSRIRIPLSSRTSLATVFARKASETGRSPVQLITTECVCVRVRVCVCVCASHSVMKCNYKPLHLQEFGKKCSSKKFSCVYLLT